MDSETYDQLMDEEGKSHSECDSLLESSPFNNSFTRLDVDLVVNAIRKNSLQDANSTSPLFPDEKKVNISNLSDLVPEESSEYLNNTDEDVKSNRMRPGELNEVQEVDEEISDDVLASPRHEGEKGLTQMITEQLNNDSATVLDMQSSSATRKASQDYNNMQLINMGHKRTPSLTDESNFLTNPNQNEERSPDQITAEQHENDSDSNNNLYCDENFAKEDQGKDLELLIPPSPVHNEEQRVTSARFDHRRNVSNGGELNPFVNFEPEKHGLTQIDTESESQIERD